MSAAAQLRITRLAADRGVHRGFRWLHLHQQQMRHWQLEMLRIPAPTFKEAERAAWFLQQFRALGLERVRADAAGNAVAELSGADGAPVVLVSAHLDTVFPAGTVTDPIESDDGRIHAPGACDNGAGLSALLGLAAALKQAAIKPAATIVFAANVSEEGEGDLRGMRHIFTGGEFAGRIAAAIALEGGGNSALITRALGSRRFRVSAGGPGGHSWTDAGAPNPILQLARGLLGIESLPELAEGDGSRRTTLNVGLFAGGTSINSIPSSATAHLDLRSTDAEHLEIAAKSVCASLRASVTSCDLRIEEIGSRPAGCLPDDSPLLATIRAVDRHLGLRTEGGLGSTDANIPLSLGVPGIAVGTGGLGGGIHTFDEWYDPAGRQPALRRILLTIADTARRVAEDGTGYGGDYARELA